MQANVITAQIKEKQKLEKFKKFLSVSRMHRKKDKQPMTLDKLMLE